MNSYGFILTRHVNSEKTNKYWNYCVQCIRKFYPFRKIVIIDDNSNSNFIKPDFEYKNVEIVQSEYPGRGELLPFYYFFKNAYFKNAVILHDSVFFQKRIHFEKLVNNFSIIPLWHFDKHIIDDMENTIYLCKSLNQSNELLEKLSDNIILSFNLHRLDKWAGCFGVQCFINHSFLLYIENKYNIFKLLNIVKTRPDRCCLERVMGIIFCIENPKLRKNSSIFGNILHPRNNWGLTFEEYIKNRKKYKAPLVKVWTGR